VGKRREYAAFSTAEGLPSVVECRAPWGQMQGSATTAMPERIQEHRRAAEAREQRSRAMTSPQMALRRRNPQGGRQFARAFSSVSFGFIG